MLCDACHLPLLGSAGNVQLVLGEMVPVTGSIPRLRGSQGTTEWLLCGTCAAYVEAGIRHLVSSGGADALGGNGKSPDGRALPDARRDVTA